MQNLQPLIEQQPFFKGLSPEFMKPIVACASTASHGVDSYVFHEGREANHFYIVTKGKVALEVFVPGRGPITVDTIETDDALGWSWLFPPYQWVFSARVLEPVDVLVFDGECLRAECDRNHDLGYELTKRFARVMQDRLQATRLQLIDLYGAGR
ncbi:MAG TPA: cyclic nucleotide-binding domain-containing protein [Aggregatilineales bacterium]|nr:cyclic nucleotide-binding domain-containing protein [Aggregatilineales bacterium]